MRRVGRRSGTGRGGFLIDIFGVGGAAVVFSFYFLRFRIAYYAVCRGEQGFLV